MHSSIAIQKKTFFSNLDPYLNFCVYKTSLLNFNLKRNICFEIRAIVTYYRPYFIYIFQQSSSSQWWIEWLKVDGNIEKIFMWNTNGWKKITRTNMCSLLYEHTNTRYVYINKDKVKLIMKKLIKHWPIIKKIFLNRRTRTFSINQKLFH